MPQLLERFDLDLPYPLAREVEILTYLFECMLGAYPDTETHSDDLLLAFSQ